MEKATEEKRYVLVRSMAQRSFVHIMGGFGRQGLVKITICIELWVCKMEGKTGVSTQGK